MQWQHFSYKWYLELFKDSNLWHAFAHSIILGIISALITTIISAYACLNIIFLRIKTTNFLRLLTLVIILPDIVIGVSLLILFNMLKIPLGFSSLLIAHVSFCIPFAILTLFGRFKTFDINIYYSALDLGANKANAYKKVLLPTLLPAIISAFLLCFTLSFDDVIISYFIAGPDFNIMPLLIFSLIKLGTTPELNALCSIIVSFSILLVSLAYFITGSSYEK